MSVKEKIKQNKNAGGRNAHKDIVLIDMPEKEFKKLLN